MKEIDGNPSRIGCKAQWYYVAYRLNEADHLILYAIVVHLNERYLQDKAFSVSRGILVQELSMCVVIFEVHVTVHR